MPTLIHSCEPLFSSTSIIFNSVAQRRVFKNCSVGKPPKYDSTAFKLLSFSSRSLILSHTHLSSCSKNDVLEELSDIQLTNRHENDDELEELGLLSKPSPKPNESNGSAVEFETELQKPDKEEVLEPFYKFFKTSDVSEESIRVAGWSDNNENNLVEEETEIVADIEYYDPKPGDCVVGVVVSGNDNKLDVNVGADMLGTILTKEVLPLYNKELDYLLCDVEKDIENFMVRGRIGILKSDEALSGESGPGKPVVEPGTVLFAEVLGRTLSGRPLLSTRRLFRRMAWHRVRQIQQLNDPILVKITEWNTGGLLTRIEGLRAFVPKAELINRVNNFTELKENVGRQICVHIMRINEDTNDLILSEREAWEMINLREGTLLDGTVRKIFPYGAQIRIGETNRSGLLHISKITKGHITSVSDLLAIDEKVKVLVLKSMFPNKISLSIADLESEPGLFVSNKEKVFSDAEEMAKKYRQKKAVVSAARKLECLPVNPLPFEDEVNLYANWKWFKFE